MLRAGCNHTTGPELELRPLPLSPPPAILRGLWGLRSPLPTQDSPTWSEFCCFISAEDSAAQEPHLLTLPAGLRALFYPAPSLPSRAPAPSPASLDGGDTWGQSRQRALQGRAGGVNLMTDPRDWFRAGKEVARHQGWGCSEPGGGGPGEGARRSQRRGMGLRWEGMARAKATLHTLNTY